MANRRTTGQRVTSKYKYLGQHPTNAATDWTDRVQGVTHNRDHWIFTQLTRIHKFPISQDLTKANRRNAAAVIDMPQELVDRGCDHFGDPDYMLLGNTGYLFVPVEGSDRMGPFRIPTGDCGSLPKVAVFQDDGSGGQFSYVGFSALPRQTDDDGTNRAGWVAINPRNFYLYSSNNQISTSWPIFRYQIDFLALQKGTVSLTAVRASLVPKDRRNRPVNIPKYLQGGCFAPDGRLFLLSGAPGLRQTAQGKGIFVIGSDGRLIDQSSTASNADFRYQFDPGSPNFQEPEGISYWNVANISGAHSRVNGELHAIVLNPQRGGRDKIWFKHFSTPNPPPSGDGVPVYWQLQPVPVPARTPTTQTQRATGR